MIPREEGDYDTVRPSQIRDQAPAQAPQTQTKAPGQDIQIQDAARTSSPEDRAEAERWILEHPEEQPENNLDDLRAHARAEMPPAPPLFVEDQRGVMMPADQVNATPETLTTGPTMTRKEAGEALIRPGDEPIFMMDSQTGYGAYKAAIVGPGTRVARADRNVETDPDAIPAFDSGFNRIKGGYYDLIDKRFELYDYEEHGSPGTLGEMGIEKMGRTGLEQMNEKLIRDYYAAQNKATSPVNTAPAGKMRVGGIGDPAEASQIYAQYGTTNPARPINLDTGAGGAAGKDTLLAAGMPGTTGGLDTMTLNGREYKDVGALKLIGLGEGIAGGYEKLAAWIRSMYNPRDQTQQINREFVLGAGRIGAGAVSGIPMAAGALLGLTEQSVQDYASGNTIKIGTPLGDVPIASKGLVEGYTMALFGGTKKETREYQAMGPQYLDIVDEQGKIIETQRLPDAPITIKETTETRLPSLPESLATGAAPSLFTKNPNLGQAAGELAMTGLLLGMGARSFGRGTRANPMIEGVGSRNVISRAATSARAETYVRGLSTEYRAPARAAVDIMKIADETPQRVARAPDLADVEHVPPELAPAIEKTFLDVSQDQPRVYGGATKSQAINTEFRPTSDVDIMTSSATRLGQKAVENLNRQEPGVARLEGSQVVLAKDYVSGTGKTYRAGQKLLDIHDPASNVLGQSDILPPPLKSQIFRGGADYRSPVSSESLQSYGTMRKSNALLSNLKEIDVTGGSHRFVKDFGDLVVYGKETKMGLEQLGNTRQARRLQTNIDTLLNSKYTYKPFPEGGTMSPVKVTRTGREIYTDYLKGYGREGINVNIIRAPEKVSPSIATRASITSRMISPSLAIASRTSNTPSPNSLYASPSISANNRSSGMAISSPSYPGITLRSLSFPTIKNIQSLAPSRDNSISPITSITGTRSPVTIKWTSPSYGGRSPSPSPGLSSNSFKTPAPLKFDLGGGSWPGTRKRGRQRSWTWRNQSIFDWLVI